MTVNSTFIIASFSLSLLSGCASFQGNNLHPVKSFPKTMVKKTVYVDLTYLGRPTLSGNEREKKRYENTCIKRMTKSGLFGSTSTEQIDSDIDVVITIRQDFTQDPPGNPFVTSSEKYTCNLKAIVTDTRSGQKSIIQLEDSIQTYISPFCLPLTPFYYPSYVKHKLNNTLFDNLCFEIYKTGMLEESEPPR